MSTDHDKLIGWMRDRLTAHIDTSAVGGKRESLDRLRKSEWSVAFETLMRNRLLMGRFRYGKMNRTQDTGYDRIESAIRRLKNYQKTGNQEFLVDAANMCLLEFEHGTHPNKHFEAIDDGEHVMFADSK